MLGIEELVPHPDDDMQVGLNRHDGGKERLVLVHLHNLPRQPLGCLSRAVPIGYHPCELGGDHGDRLGGGLVHTIRPGVGVGGDVGGSSLVYPCFRWYGRRGFHDLGFRDVDVSRRLVCDRVDFVHVPSPGDRDWVGRIPRRPSIGFVNLDISHRGFRTSPCGCRRFGGNGFRQPLPRCSCGVPELVGWVALTDLTADTRPLDGTARLTPEDERRHPLPLAVSDPNANRQSPGSVPRAFVMYVRT